MNKVPTHQTRLKLESKGRIIHDFAFDRDWPEWRLRSAIEEEMPMLMTVEYEFLKVWKKNIYYDFIPPPDVNELPALRIFAVDNVPMG